MQNQLSPAEGKTSRSLNLLLAGRKGNEPSIGQTSELGSFRIIREHIQYTYVMVSDNIADFPPHFLGCIISFLPYHEWWAMTHLRPKEDLWWIPKDAATWLSGVTSNDPKTPKTNGWRVPKWWFTYRWLPFKVWPCLVSMLLMYEFQGCFFFWREVHNASVLQFFLWFGETYRFDDGWIRWPWCGTNLSFEMDTNLRFSRKIVFANGWFRTGCCSSCWCSRIFISKPDLEQF